MGRKESNQTNKQRSSKLYSIKLDGKFDQSRMVKAKKYRSFVGPTLFLNAAVIHFLVYFQDSEWSMVENPDISTAVIHFLSISRILNGVWWRILIFQQLSFISCIFPGFLVEYGGES